MTAIAAEFRYRHSQFTKRLKYWHSTTKLNPSQCLSVGVVEVGKKLQCIVWKFFDERDLFSRLETSFTSVETVDLKEVNKKTNKCNKPFKVILVTVLVTLYTW